MSDEEKRESNRAEKPDDAARQQWYNIKRMAQRLRRHPEEADRITQQIISTADGQLKNSQTATDS